MATYNLTTGIDGLYQKEVQNLLPLRKKSTLLTFRARVVLELKCYCCYHNNSRRFLHRWFDHGCINRRNCRKTITVELSSGTDLQTATAIDAAAGTGVSTALNTYLTAGDTIQVKLLDASTIAGKMGITVVGFQTPLTYTNSTYAF